jgi:hypothetical protein
MRIIFAACLVLLSAVLSGHVQGQGKRGNYVDIWKFDVGNVRLKMSGNEAIEAFKQKFGSSTPVVEQKSVLNEPESTIYYTTQNSRLVPGKTYIRSVHYKVNGKYTYEVLLAESLPNAPIERPESAFRVMLWQNDIKTRADIDQFEQAVLSKYGSPTSDDNSYHHRKTRWCLGPDKHGFPCGMQYLEWARIQGYFLDLADLSYTDEVDDAYNRMLRAQKPPL